MIAADKKITDSLTSVHQTVAQRYHTGTSVFCYLYAAVHSPNKMSSFTCSPPLTLAANGGLTNITNGLI